MNETKFILANLAARVTGTKVPPYWLFGQSAAGGVDSPGFDALQALDEEELADTVRANALGVPMRMPLELKADGGDWWLLPVEPLVTLTGRNVVARRQVAKGVRGSIKERWAQDDYQVDIEGVIINYSAESYPRDGVRILKNLCEAARLQVRCPLFELFSINQIVVEDYAFPFTAGVRNQAYRITAWSDDVYKLLLKRKDLT